MNRAIFIVVVANRAVEQMIAEDDIHRFKLRLADGGDSVITFIPACTAVEHARVNLPLTSTMQVSQVWIGPRRG